MDAKLLKRLHDEAKDFGCSYYLATLDPLYRIDLLNKFAFDRMVTKAQQIIELYNSDEGGRNWDQTLYLYFFRSLGLPSNGDVYMELARRVGYNTILKERYKPESLEALLIAASGILEEEGEADQYLHKLKGDGDYLMRKYCITPMDPAAWDKATHAASQPLLRLSQAATLFAKHGRLHDLVMACKGESDVATLFMVPASEYWHTHYVPLRSSRTRVKRIGSELANIIGINLVAPYRFAYGQLTHDEELSEEAFLSWEKMSAERNQIIKGWGSTGLRAANAYDSQALIGLYKQHCHKSLCERCPVAKSIERQGGLAKLAKLNVY